MTYGRHATDTGGRHRATGTASRRLKFPDADGVLKRYERLRSPCWPAAAILARIAREVTGAARGVVKSVPRNERTPTHA